MMAGRSDLRFLCAPGLPAPGQGAASGAGGGLVSTTQVHTGGGDKTPRSKVLPWLRAGLEASSGPQAALAVSTVNTGL